jgi:monoamine oxidase
MTVNLTADVVVVGAGISGLTAARELQNAGLTVEVLEARNRVGGKVFTSNLVGRPVDLGAHWLDARHVRVQAMAAEFGLSLERQSTEGRHVIVTGDRRRHFTGEVPMRPFVGIIELAARMFDLESKGRRLPTERPFVGAKAAHWDAMTLADWLAGVVTDTARGGMLVACRTIFGAEPDDVSLLFAIDYFRSSGGIRRLTRFRGGAQEFHIVGGAAGLTDGLATELDKPVLLNNPVRSITHTAGEVEVTSQNVAVRGGHVIVAAAPATLAAFTWDPPLPQWRNDLHRSLALGGYAKAVLAYDRAWWRDDGLSGLAIADAGLVQMTVDVGAHNVDNPGHLAAFITGAPARQLPHDSDRRMELIVSAVAKLLGPQAFTPIAYQDLNWTSEPWSLGAPVSLMAPGMMTTFGPHLQMPTGRVHWAGTEHADAFVGYLEGAIRSGERAAQAVLGDLCAVTGNRAKESEPS